MAQLFAFREDRLGFRFNIDKRAVLGRAPECNLILFDRSASRQHAEIFLMDDIYYIADMASTNGTLVNDRPITMQTRLYPYDTIKIGQELFVFEPQLDIISGLSPSAIIIEHLKDDSVGYLSREVGDAAQKIAPDDITDLMLLASSLSKIGTMVDFVDKVEEYLKRRFKMTFFSILWPVSGPGKRMTSFLSSHDDRRMLLSQTPYQIALDSDKCLLWPMRIKELNFTNGKRHVTKVDEPVLIAPMYNTSEDKKGLFYLESSGHVLDEKDMNAFSAMIMLLSPIVAMVKCEHDKQQLKTLAEEEKNDLPLNLSTSDDKVKIIFATAMQVASTDSSVLLSGEAGTGKSTLAQYIHQSSPRRHGRLVSMSLSSVPPNDIERVLVGQFSGERGLTAQAGMIEMADGGTLFLQHVEYLTPAAQKTILMAIEEGLFLPISSPRARTVDLRVISSTSIDLWERVEAGYFREDLYARLSHMTISMPPLREIKNDLDWMVNNFMSRAAKNLGLNFTGIDPAAMECLRSYPWPGNIAELKRVVELMVLFSRNGRVVLEDFPVYLRLSTDAFLDSGDDVPSLVLEAERQQLLGAMSRCNGDVEAVGEMLGQRPENIILKMRYFGLEPMDYQNPLQHSSNYGPGQTTVPG